MNESEDNRLLKHSDAVERISTGVNRRDVLQAFAAAGIISTTGAETVAAATGRDNGVYAAGDSSELADALVFQHKLTQQNKWANPQDAVGRIDGERAGGSVGRERNLDFDVEPLRGLVLQFRGVAQDNNGGSYNVPLDRLPEPNGQAITWSVWVRPWGPELWHTIVSRSLGFGL